MNLALLTLVGLTFSGNVLAADSYPMITGSAETKTFACRTEDGGKEYLTFTVDRRKGYIFFGRFVVHTQSSRLEPIFEDRLTEMDTTVITDKFSRLDFRVNRSATGNERLRVKLTVYGETATFNNCILTDERDNRI